MAHAVGCARREAWLDVVDRSAAGAAAAAE